MKYPRVRLSLVCLFVLASHVSPASAREFRRENAFKSVADFVSEARVFLPSKDGKYMGYLFTTFENAGRPDAGLPVVADKIDEVQVLGSDDLRAVVMVKASPETKGRPSHVAVFFSLSRDLKSESWKITDLRVFTVYGSRSGIIGEITSWEPAPDKHEPLWMTITTTNGDARNSFEISTSFSITNGEIENEVY